MSLLAHFLCVCAFEDVLYCAMIDHAVVFFSSSFSILFHFTSIEIYVCLLVCARDCLYKKTYISICVNLFFLIFIIIFCFAVHVCFCVHHKM